MGTKVIPNGKTVERGNLVVGIGDDGKPYALLGGAPVTYEDGGEIEREGTLAKHKIRDRLHMDTVGPPGRQAARFVYTGEVVHDDPTIAGTHFLTCWLPFPKTGRKFEVAEEGFESEQGARRSRVIRFALMGLLLGAMLAILAVGVLGP
jgi:hypothetical protein